MAYSLLEMQGNIRAEFETMLQFVTSEEAQTATADQVEKRLFRLLLSLGTQLLLLFFQMRSQTCSRHTIAVNGQDIPYHSEQKRVYLSIFGEIPVWRPYFYASEAGGHTPLDAELSLGIDRYSDLLRETLTTDAFGDSRQPFFRLIETFKMGQITSNSQFGRFASNATD
jgi:hypothetical protein